MSVPRKKSSVRHTRSLHRNRRQRPSGEVSPEQIEAVMKETVNTVLADSDDPMAPQMDRLYEAVEDLTKSDPE
jgi:hypothetical protein